MRKVLLAGALALIGLAAPAAPALATAASAGTASAAPSHAAAPAAPGLYHVPIIGKVTLPGLGSPLGSRGLRHATQVQSSNWSGYSDVNDTYNSVASTWTEPTVDCSSGGVSIGGLLGTLFGGPSAAAAFWVGLDGYNSSSVEQLGTDSDCNSGTPSYYAWYEMYPNPSITLPGQYPVHPGDVMTGWVASNSSGTSFVLALKDATQGWTFSTTQAGSGFARSSAEVIAEAPSECALIFCSEVALANFGKVNFSGSTLIDNAGKQGTLSAFPADEITMTGQTGSPLATPSNLSTDGSSFSVTWNGSS
jgi:hypothetical protein